MKKLFYIFIGLLLLIEAGLIVVSIFFDFKPKEEKQETFFLDTDPRWSDTLLKHMTLNEKIGQLFFIELTNPKSDSLELFDSIVRINMLGGVKFRNSELLNQLILTNQLQAHSKYPLFIASEGSIINRENFCFPMSPLISATNDSSFIDLYLDHFSEILKIQGVQIDFSNNLNLSDSLFLNSGFSDKNDRLLSISSGFKRKLHQNQIISSFNLNDKLFFSSDSILIDSLSKLNIYSAIQNYFALQQNSLITSTILAGKAKYNFAEFYKKQYKFKGLIFTNLPDSVSKTGIKKLFRSGTDVFISTGNQNKFIGYIKELLISNEISDQEINKKVKKILMAKKWTGLDKQEFKSAEISMSKINNPLRRIISWKMYEKTICLLKNKENSIPILTFINNPVLLFVKDVNNYSWLKTGIKNYTEIDIKDVDEKNLVQATSSKYNNIIAVIDKPIEVKGKDSTFLKKLIELSARHRLILVNFGNPSNIKSLDFAQVVIHSYESHPFAQRLIAQVICGAVSPKGEFKPLLHTFAKKPNFNVQGRLQYAIPEAAGFRSEKLDLIDSLIYHTIQVGAMPGCQVLAAKNGIVFYYKSFGYHTYQKNQPVNNEDIYDIASITKVAATTIAAMKLYEMGKINLEDSIKDLIEDTTGCIIKNHQLRDFFLHQTGLQPNMPILQYINYRKPGIGRYDIYFNSSPDTSYTIEVAGDFYLRKDYLDSIKQSLYKLEWDSTKAYNYSDINFNIIYDVLLRKVNGKYIDFLNSSFYKPLQLRTLGFLPLDRFPKRRIAPTQEDKYWRKQLIRGFPHDESAALYGGVAGNAGLFSNANDLAVLFQMLLNGGSYGRRKVLKKETIEYFTSSQEDSPRGLGFSRKDGFFGHTGFTGCVVWANPETQMIFVFLSNSIHPRPANQKFKRLEIRERTLDMVLRAYDPSLIRIPVKK